MPRPPPSGSPAQLTSWRWTSRRAHRRRAQAHHPLPECRLCPRDVTTKIEMGRYFSWRAADYLDKHDQHAELVGAMNKIQVTEMMFDCVFKCMQIVGVSSLEARNGFGKLLRKASVLPIYDGGNMGMQRRRVHGILTDPMFNPRSSWKTTTSNSRSPTSRSTR
ncbi:MAG TPA: acyl-CoA dehydrogenase family protein [Pseudonocardiaceae bacterium]